MSKALAIFCIVLGVILLAGFAFGFYVLLESTNYFQCNATDFWLTVNGNRYYTEGNAVLSDTTIEVHYLVGWLSRKQGYTYKILPAGDDFGYSVDGVVRSYLDIEDLTPAFEVVEQDKRLTIACKQLTVTDVLCALYSNQDVAVAPIDEDKPHFKLVVTSVDGKEVALTFRGWVPVDNIEVDPPSVTF